MQLLLFVDTHQVRTSWSTFCLPLHHMLFPGWNTCRPILGRDTSRVLMDRPSTLLIGIRDRPVCQRDIIDRSGVSHAFRNVGSSPPNESLFPRGELAKPIVFLRHVCPLGHLPVDGGAVGHAFFLDHLTLVWRRLRPSSAIDDLRCRPFPGPRQTPLLLERRR